jgi:hypothetical protein
MVFVLILSGVLLFTTFTYLLVAHYVLAMEVGKIVKKTPPDVILLPLDPKNTL